MSQKFESNGSTFKVKWKSDWRGCAACAFRGDSNVLCWAAPDCDVSAQGSTGGFKVVWVRQAI